MNDSKKLKEIKAKAVILRELIESYDSSAEDGFIICEEITLLNGVINELLTGTKELRDMGGIGAHIWPPAGIREVACAVQLIGGKDE